MTQTPFLHGDLTRRILIAFFAVYNELGTGFLESVYRAALARALVDDGLRIELEWPIDVYFRGTRVGHFSADILVEGSVLVEVKAVRTLVPAHRAQAINYLRSTNIEVCVLLNFGTSPEHERLIYSNDRKHGRRRGDS